MTKLNFDTTQFASVEGGDRALIIMLDHLPQMRKEFKAYAIVRRALWQSFVDEGFTEEQAFTLCQQPLQVRT